MTEEKKEEEPKMPPIAIVDKDTAKEIDNALGSMMTNPNFLGIIKQFADLAEVGKEEGRQFQEALNKKLTDIMVVLMALHQNQVLDHEILEKLVVVHGFTDKEIAAIDAKVVQKASIYKAGVDK